MQCPAGSHISLIINHDYLRINKIFFFQFMCFLKATQLLGHKYLLKLFELYLLHSSVRYFGISFGSKNTELS